MLWHSRVMGLLIAATLACTAAHSTRAEPRPADGCRRTAFRVIIDVGHTEQAPGASSARGVSEFTFNVNLARRIEQQLLAAGFRRSVLLITEGPSGKGLVERVTRANALEADLFLSVHHDSVPDEFLEKWEFEGEQRPRGGKGIGPQEAWHAYVSQLGEQVISELGPSRLRAQVMLVPLKYNETRARSSSRSCIVRFKGASLAIEPAQFARSTPSGHP